jgi:hypothetical protein
MSDLIKIVGLVLLVALIIAIGPLLTIWALNTLFPVLAIPYTFWTWLAVIFLGVFIRSDINIKK